MNRKRISTIALLATALLLTASALPIFVRAQGGTTLSVTPSLSSGELGERFTVSVEVSDIPNLVVYAFALRYDTRVLTVDSASLGGSVFDYNMNGDIGDDPVAIPFQDVLEGLGLVRYTVGTFGEPVSVMGSASLLTVDFVVDSLGMSTIEILGSSLVVRTETGAAEYPHDTVNGEYRTAANLMLTGQGCRAIVQGRTRDRVQFMCTVTNVASVPIEVAAEFRYQSLGPSGQSGIARTTPEPLAPGDSRTILTRITLLPMTETESFSARGTVFRVVMSPDGLMDIEGQTSMFGFDAGR